MSNGASSSTTHVPGHVDIEGEQGNVSEVEAQVEEEDDWYGDTQDVQTTAQVTSSNARKAVNDEVCLLTLLDL